MAHEKYVLATGDTAIERLKVVEATHGPDTQAFLKRAGLREGLHVADIGCGVGIVSQWIALQVGSSGSVIGVDASAEQTQTATQLAQKAGLTNLRFHTASAYATGLPYGTFDMVFCRFLLMHLAHPQRALREMASLLKPGGVLAVEDGDFTAVFCWPPSPAYERCFELYRAAGAQQGADFTIGRKLFSLVRDLGLHSVQVNLAQPIFAEGAQKLLPGWTIEEATENLVAAGLATREEINDICQQLRRMANDESVVFGMARMMQVWGTK
ncbi:methylase involved in ubiquinone/menaquinone biosynthesis [Chthonomonas calidirosea]|uniref:Methylase involved in ubiquinone/menaquinone biosynthesis n=1 Tax=Chthonomonas calidirosea (strain DSM 23976 / ICMP 18418 / T49) TaxID=1303518 RepID=S0EWA4_CHTCT|nr:class I SAM-dependent methyltransferase [Chthonomonas calidirosea]CCW33948.1 Methylase involved in ubiquinone/menaquinone biosynthesis [Chthonomonas calidirosea T49]CEK16199.1 methylase involved in ubiquinone/menaquinone biosynthesis [Chthonomonas calidirosea]